MEENKKMMLRQLEYNQKAYDQFDNIIEVIEKFDMKEPSKRLDTALKNVSKSLKFEISYNSFIINYCNHDEIYIKECNEYLKDDTKILLHMSCVSVYGGGALFRGRIDSKIIIEQLKKNKEYHENIQRQAYEQLSIIDELEEEREKLEKMLEDFNAKILYTTDKYFNIRI